MFINRKLENIWKQAYEKVYASEFEDEKRRFIKEGFYGIDEIILFAGEGAAQVANDAANDAVSDAREDLLWGTLV